MEFDVNSIEVFDSSEPIIFEEFYTDFAEMEVKVEEYRSRLDRGEILSIEEAREIVAFMSAKRQRQFSAVLAAKKKKEPKPKAEKKVPALPKKRETKADIDISDLEF